MMIPSHVLQKLLEVYEGRKGGRLTKSDQFRARNYKMLIPEIKQLDVELTLDNIHDLIKTKKLKNLKEGGTLIETVKDILKEGRSSKLQLIDSFPVNKANSALTKIWGVGPATSKILQVGDAYILVILQRLAIPLV